MNQSFEFNNLPREIKNIIFQTNRDEATKQHRAWHVDATKLINNEITSLASHCEKLQPNAVCEIVKKSYWETTPIGWLNAPRLMPGGPTECHCMARKFCFEHRSTAPHRCRHNPQCYPSWWRPAIFPFSKKKSKGIPLKIFQLSPKHIIWYILYNMFVWYSLKDKARIDSIEWALQNQTPYNF